jgi:hypothetical protein
MYQPTLRLIKTRLTTTTTTTTTQLHHHHCAAATTIIHSEQKRVFNSNTRGQQLWVCRPDHCNSVRSHSLLLQTSISHRKKISHNSCTTNETATHTTKLVKSIHYSKMTTPPPTSTDINSTTNSDVAKIDATTDVITTTAEDDVRTTVF